MIELELSPISHRIVNDLLAVTPDDDVLVIADSERERIARAIASAARGAGGTTILSIIPRIEAHGNEPPRPTGEAMQAADIVVAATNGSLTHTRARREATDAGTRLFNLRSVTEETMLEGAINTDFEELSRRTILVRDAVAAASDVAVISPEGTDVTFDLSDREVFALDPLFREGRKSDWVTLPTGEAATSPVEGSAAGTIVVDYSMDNIGRLDAPIELTVEDGRVTDIRGETDAETLRRIVEEHDENASNIAEFAIGTNPDARLIGNLAEDKKVEGSVHFALGDNVSLGGSIESDLHVDGMVTRPTVTLDGTVAVDSGDVQWDAVRELADTGRG